MNIIDIGCSHIKSYLLIDDRVVNFCKLPSTFEKFERDSLVCFYHAGQMHSQTTMVISTSDSIVWEDKNGKVRWHHHQYPSVWKRGLTPYGISGHPRYNRLKGAGNQMMTLKNSLNNVKRILPVSAYIASVIADNPMWNGWDYTHASNSGLYDYTTSSWAAEAEPFIDAGVIDEKIYRSDHKIENGSGMRTVLLGGHDSVFANANDNPYSTRTYVSCGTWITVSVETDPDLIPARGRDRYVIAPNGTVLRQICFPSDPATVENAAVRVVEFLRGFNTGVVSTPPIRVFGSWSEKMLRHLELKSGYRYDWNEPNRFFGDTYLAEQASKFAKRSKHYIDAEPYFCEGA